MTRRGHGACRRGASLFELMAAMTAASVVMATSVGLVHRSFTFESRSRQVLADERTTARLARQFRSDIHQARCVRCEGAGEPSQRGSEPRRGGVMVVAVACMAVAAAIGLAMLRSATATSHHLRHERQLRQVERLLVAAEDLARARHASGEEVDGDAELTPQQLTGAGSAHISIARNPDDPQGVHVVVTYPLEGPLTIRRSRNLRISPHSQPSPEESLP